ncbi:hypothetical protein HDU67_004333, partial [Dinochytrium kinnereticum]
LGQKDKEALSTLLVFPFWRPDDWYSGIVVGKGIWILLHDVPLVASVKKDFDGEFEPIQFSSFAEDTS